MSRSGPNDGPDSASWLGPGPYVGRPVRLSPSQQQATGPVTRFGDPETQAAIAQANAAIQAPHIAVAEAEAALRAAVAAGEMGDLLGLYFKYAAAQRRAGAVDLPRFAELIDRLAYKAGIERLGDEG